jgi:DNA-binding NarL/FixJ family response regulator
VRFKLGRARYVALSLPLDLPSRPPELTDAEKQVLALLIEGRPNRFIARARRTSVRTVANQVASIFKKLSVTSRAELVALLTG